MRLIFYLPGARLHHAKGDRHLAKVHAIEALAITNRSDFCLLRADVNNLFAQLEMDDGNWQEAKATLKRPWLMQYVMVLLTITCQH